MPKTKAVYCRECKCMTKHTYVGRERGKIIEEVVLGVVSLGWEPLFKVARGEKFGGKTFWECTKCGCINED